MKRVRTFTIVTLVCVVSLAIAGDKVTSNLDIFKLIGQPPVSTKTGKVLAQGFGLWIDYVPEDGPPDPDPNDGPAGWTWNSGTGRYDNKSPAPGDGSTVEFFYNSEAKTWSWVRKDSNGNTIDQGTAEVAI